MAVYTYIVGHDWGFAPNPFHGTCTLACCKSKIRRGAKVGDYVFGTGGGDHGTPGQAVFWMRVDEILKFDEYWDLKRFARKKPVANGTLKRFVGDNIYHRDPKTEEFVQEHSFHTRLDGEPDAKNLKSDTGVTEKVLIGREFAYWGGAGPQVPDQLGMFICKNRDCEKRTDEAEVAAFLAWINDDSARGRIGKPNEWSYPNRKAHRRVTALAGAS